MDRVRSGLLSGIRVSKCEVYRASSEDGTDCTQCNAQTLTLPACRGQHAGTASDSNSDEEELSRLQADPEAPKRTQVCNQPSCERTCGAGEGSQRAQWTSWRTLLTFSGSWMADVISLRIPRLIRCRVRLLRIIMNTHALQSSGTADAR